MITRYFSKSATHDGVFKSVADGWFSLGVFNDPVSTAEVINIP
jgi:hypothetical protein